MGPCGFFCVLIGRYASLWILGVSNASLIVFFCAYRSLCVLTGLYGSCKVLISLFTCELLGTSS